MKVTKRLNIITMVMVLIFTTFAFTAANTVNASNKIGIVTATSLNVRTGPSTAYASIGYLKNGDKVTILGTEGTFYKISYNSSSGSVAYASTKYINIIDQGATEINPDFEAHMKAQGFPESYKPALRQLHAEHPKWIFMAQKTNLDWNTVVSQESVLGRNLVSQYRDVSWRSMEKGSYNSSTNTYMTFDGSWYAASSTVIAHYLDPRNFLNDTSIFMFESLSYNSSVHTQTNVANILNNSFMKGNYTTPDTKKTYSYAETFIAAAKDSGVSPYHLASRALQEQGTVGNALSTGTVSGFPGYFNFFNIQAYTANGYTAVQNGAKYAMTTNSKYILPWTNQRKSIIGGAIWIGTGYIDKLQDTLYLQKFDVVDGGNGYYKHQYMTNVQAPFSEASLMKKAYTTEMLNSNLIFNIPVYNNMPASACTLPNTTASTNDLLDSITIDNYSLSPSFNKYTNEYTLKVTPDVKTVTINAKANDSSATISGTGTKNIAVGNNKFTITCKSAGGTTRNYVITISKDPASYSLGDPSGDTKVNIYDAILVTRSINGNYTFNAEQQIAADANKDGKVNIFDAIYITRFVNGYFDEL